ncbi:hypothetical protein BLNAU_21615 [Blattamonas nauphoetae]|uniref:Uncharacterized protein n=1 Tax=Blattamonas nauphoetae TaxID=2049346 RepID=A0ABQ9WWI2_9EUKA|nr:hypothetical protein BLNAU_21615 [Blattamonas nauphoetae]
MTESVRLSVSRLVAQNLLLSQPIISIRSTADLPPLMDSLSTGHSSMLTLNLPYSLSPSLFFESSIFESVLLQIDATHDDPIETGSVLLHCSSLLFSPRCHIPRSCCSILSLAKYLPVVLISLGSKHRLSPVGQDSVFQPCQPFLPVRRHTEPVLACKRTGTH